MSHLSVGSFCINTNFSPLHLEQDSGTIWLLRIDLVVCTGEGRCTISDIDTSSTKSLPRVHRAVVFKTKFRHCKTQMERAEFKRMLHLLVEKEGLSVTNSALEDFERVFFTVQNAKNRGGNQEIPSGGRALN